MATAQALMLVLVGITLGIVLCLALEFGNRRHLIFRRDVRTF